MDQKNSEYGHFLRSAIVTKMFQKISKGFQKILMRKSCETGFTLEINERLMIKVTLLNKFSLKFTLLNGNNSTF